MIIGAELEQYILQTHNRKNSEASMNPLTPASGFDANCW